MRLRLGIMGQLTLGIVLTTLAGIGLVGIVAVKIIETNAVYSKVREAERMARIFDLSMRKAGPGTGALARAASELLIEGGVTTYRLKRKNGEVLASRGPLARLEPVDTRPVVAPGAVRASLVGSGFFSGPGEELVISAPLEAASVQGGTLEFIVSLADIKGSMAGVRSFLLFYALADSAVIIGFGVYFLSRSIVRPVRRLDATANRISGGTLGERAEPGPDNEVGSLAASFNRMADRLESEITELERLNLELISTQKELLRSKTLAAVGGLAAGIAHEIGNPLGAVLGYLDILARAGLSPDEERDIIERTTREINRIDAIVKEFLDVSRPGRASTDVADVGAILADTLEALRAHEDMAGVDVALDIDPALPPVVMDEGKLRQVFVNLVINAGQAMDSVAGAALRVTARVEDAPDAGTPRRRKEDLIASQAGIASDRTRVVVVSFADNGPGISEADAEKVFEPFFSTKEVGRGTGLGLYVSRTIVALYGGDLDFTSETGHGATFEVTLPAAAGV